jgi:hypothetical protein
VCSLSQDWERRPPYLVHHVIHEVAQDLLLRLVVAHVRDVQRRERIVQRVAVPAAMSTKIIIVA